MTCACSVGAPGSCCQNAWRHCSKYVRYTEWCTWPSRSQSRKGTSSEYLNRGSLRMKGRILRRDLEVPPYTVPGPTDSPQPEFTSEEIRALTPYFTNLDRPVFALVNLPETVKGALFARYSRSAKSLRRLFLDEFLGIDRAAESVAAADAPAGPVGTERAQKLYARVLNEYGDDSVAQLGGAHVACEGV